VKINRWQTELTIAIDRDWFIQRILYHLMSQTKNHKLLHIVLYQTACKVYLFSVRISTCIQ